MNSKYKDREIAKFQKQGIRKHNMAILESGSSDFMRERKSCKSNSEIPVMCSGCLGVFLLGDTSPVTD